MVKDEIKLTWAQNQWLDDHGGRNINDVRIDRQGLFVLMADGHGGDLRVPLMYKSVDKDVEK